MEFKAALLYRKSNGHWVLGAKGNYTLTVLSLLCHYQFWLQCKYIVKTQSKSSLCYVNMLFLHDNSRTQLKDQTSNHTTHSWTTLPCLLYRPYLAPSDFHLFGSMKRIMILQWWWFERKQLSIRQVYNTFKDGIQWLRRNEIILMIKFWIMRLVSIFMCFLCYYYKSLIYKNEEAITSVWSTYYTSTTI